MRMCFYTAIVLVTDVLTFSVKIIERLAKPIIKAYIYCYKF